MNKEQIELDLDITMRWYSIETAPKDGTKIIVSSPKMLAGKALPICYFQDMLDEDDYCGWVIDEELRVSLDDCPTHWMPLHSSLEGE